LEAHSVRHEFLAMAIIVVIASTIAIAPMLVLGPVSGHDFPFHLASWMDVARQWHHGAIYPQWAELANWGFGEPRFVFYPPGSWMLGASLGSLFPWKAVPVLFIWLVLIGAGISMFMLAREALPARQAVLAAVLFAANPYHLLLIYYRSDFAELLASAFFPLLPLGVVWIAREGWRRVPMLALVVALIWLSNAPAAVIAVYSLVFLLLLAYAAERDRRLLMYGATALAGGFGLAAFYILPAARERAWVQINQVITDGLRPEQNFLFTRSTSMAVNTDFNIKISCVILLMGVLAAAASYYVAKSSAIPRCLHYALLIALGVMSLFMMLPLSRLLWLLAPELHFVQFPWRYAVPFGVAFSFLLGAAAGKSNKLAILAVGLFIFAGPSAKILLAIEKPSSWKKAEISRLQQSIDNGTGYRGTPEYLPNGAVSKVLSENVIRESRITGKSVNEVSTNGNGEQNKFQVHVLQPQQITLKRFDFPTWQVNLDGTRFSSKRRDSDGEIVVSVPPGKHVIQIFLQREWDAKLGIAISITSAISLLGLTFLARRKEKVPATVQSRFKIDLPTVNLQARVVPMGSEKRS
jgi:hypothetical protein